MKKKRSKIGIAIIIIVVICVLAFIVTFLVPRPVLTNTEQLAENYITTYDSYSEDGSITSSMEFFDEIPIQNAGGDLVATIGKDDLVTILESTNCKRVINVNFQYHLNFEVERLYGLDFSTNRGPIHIVIGKNESFWYRSADDFFRYKIQDSQTFLKRITEAMMDIR
jgi:hypothetical protein